MRRLPSIPLPPGWSRYVKSGLLHAVALARAALIDVRTGFENSPLERARLIAKADRVAEQNALLKEELRIKDTRMARIAGRERPRYDPAERLAILNLRAGAGWNAAETARRFLLTPPTIASWTRRLDEQGSEALVRTPEPVNRFPDFVAAVVRRLRAAAPSLGKRKVADVLARAGLHLAPTTAARLAKSAQRAPPPQPDPEEAWRVVAEGGPRLAARSETGAPRVVTARYPLHLWQIDMTVIPTALGLWVPWWPFSFALCWPFGWHVAIVLDHFSRAVIATAAFAKEPSANDVVLLLDRAVAAAGRAPRHIVSDHGSQFQSEYRAWCERSGAKPRFGAIGQHGSIAVLERFHRSLKDECFRKLVVPLALPRMLTELAAFVFWYNTERPHASLSGATPKEKLEGRLPACDGPRFEPRARLALARGDPKPAHRGTDTGTGTHARLELVLNYVAGRQHLPVVRLREAA